jgi:hypothetical protein
MNGVREGSHDTIVILHICSFNFTVLYYRLKCKLQPDSALRFLICQCRSEVTFHSLICDYEIWTSDVRCTVLYSTSTFVYLISILGFARERPATDLRLLHPRWSSEVGDQVTCKSVDEFGIQRPCSNIRKRRQA